MSNYGGGEFKVVPWSCDAEWKHVFDLLYAHSMESRQMGVDIVEVWKVRSSGGIKLSLSVELTAELVQSKIVFERTGSGIESKLLLSAALIRFVSLLSDLDQVKKSKQPISRLCSQLGIPVWISELRNDSAHSTLPSTEIVVAAIDVCLEYLKNNYWFPHWFILFEMNDHSLQSVRKLIDSWVDQSIDDNSLFESIYKLQHTNSPHRNHNNAPHSYPLTNEIDLEFLLNCIDSMSAKFFEANKGLEPFISLCGPEFVYRFLTADFVIQNRQQFLSFFDRYYDKLKGYLKRKHAKVILRTILLCGDVDFCSRSEKFSDFVDNFVGERKNEKYSLMSSLLQKLQEMKISSNNGTIEKTDDVDALNKLLDQLNEMSANEFFTSTDSDDLQNAYASNDLVSDAFSCGFFNALSLVIP